MGEEDVIFKLYLSGVARRRSLSEAGGGAWNEGRGKGRGERFFGGSGVREVRRLTSLMLTFNGARRRGGPLMKQSDSINERNKKKDLTQ